MKKIFFIAVFFINAFFVSAEMLGSSSYNFTIDLPEGFSPVDSNMRDRFLFSHSLLPCELQISFDPAEKFSDCKSAGENIFQQLKARHKDMQFLWCQNNAQLSTFEFQTSGNYSGWLLVLQLENGWLTLTAYSKKEDAKRCEPLIISAFDSVYTSGASWYIPGPVTTCLYKRENPVRKTLTFNGTPIRFFIDKIDMEANKSVVDREFELLTHYLSTDAVIPAWKRYYKNIFRDAWTRLHSFSFEIKNALTHDRNMPNEQEITAKVLAHVQNFNYVRDHQGADFVDLVTACATSTGDCDSRSLLMSVVLAQLGIKTVLFVSPEYSHAVCGIAISGKGANMRVSNKDYLLAETTAHVPIGQIAADIADPRKWFAVELYGLPSAF